MAFTRIPKISGPQDLGQLYGQVNQLIFELENLVGSGGGGDSLILTTTSHASSAAILAWHTTPTVIAPALGANKIIFPLWLQVKYNFVTTPYGLSGDEQDAELRYIGVGTVLDGKAICNPSPVFPVVGASADFLAVTILQAFSISATITGLDVADKAIGIVGDPATPYVNGDGTIDFLLWYLELDVV